MEKLNLSELVSLARNAFVDFDALLRQDEDGSLVDLHGVTYKRGTDECFKVELQSDASYDKLSAMIKILNGILEYRPLPF